MTDDLIPYRLLRSNRRTIGIEIRNGQVFVRAPLRCPDEDIRKLIRQKQHWIQSCLTKQADESTKALQEGFLSDEEIRLLGEKARRELPPRVSAYAARMGVSYRHITIRCQKTRWGSCSSKGGLNFNCLLMLCPEPVQDSVIVHELCHLRHMDHSSAFYEEVRKFFPDYDQCSAWLKANGGALLKRAGR